MSYTLRTWIEVDTKALRANVSSLRKTLDTKTAFMAVVKANAYGHGLEEVLTVLKKEKVDWYGVFDEDDALIVRSYTNKPILVLRSTPISFWKDAVAHNITITVSTESQLQALKKWKGKQPAFHLKVDTGLGRQGFLRADQKKVFAYLKTITGLRFTGLYTHFSGTESKKFDTYTKKQVEELQSWLSLAQASGYSPLTHASATSGALKHSFPDSQIARFGIGLYGLYPSEEIQKQFKSKAKLTPVLSWRTEVSEVKNLKAGSLIAYDCTYKMKRDGKIGLLPVGYWDGIPRSFSNKGSVLVRGIKAPIIGRVMMNMCVVDVSNIKGIKQGDMVTLIGKDGKTTISIEEAGKWADTINYELVTRINPLIPRILV